MVAELGAVGAALGDLNVALGALVAELGVDEPGLEAEPFSSVESPR